MCKVINVILDFSLIIMYNMLDYGYQPLKSIMIWQIDILTGLDAVVLEIFSDPAGPEAGGGIPWMPVKYEFVE